ncbi:MAG: hypothetical protein H0X01_07080 [Nitrospira sp.]|nr:hypothetical protein [Nitrospira sp.]
MLTRAELYDRLKSQIQHEDELIIIRVVWQLLAQSFFFSTYATLLNVKQDAKSFVLGGSSNGREFPRSACLSCVF